MELPTLKDILTRLGDIGQPSKPEDNLLTPINEFGDLFDDFLKDRKEKKQKDSGKFTEADKEETAAPKAEGNLLTSVIKLFANL